MKDRIEEFHRENIPFVYINLSGLRLKDEFAELLTALNETVAKHNEHSVSLIIDFKDARMDSVIKSLIIECMTYTKKYVKYSVVILVDGAKKLASNSIFKLSGHSSVHYALTKNSAIEWLLQQYNGKLTEAHL